MTDIAVIILVGQERLHIRRCIEKLQTLDPRQVFVVESQPSDGTHEIAVEMGALTAFNKWPGLQSVQFNWALDNLPIEAKWILRLDADEYLTPESIDWLKANLDGIDEKVSALEFTLERKFMGGAIRHGTNGIPMVRLFRRGRGRYAETLMDERIVFDGEKLSVPVVFYDDNLNTLEWWKEKHRCYAKREAQQAIESQKSGIWTDPRKAKYYRLSPYFRAFAYFCIRYFLKLGILDGIAGFRWHFWQGLWYRWIVDREIAVFKRKFVVDVGKLMDGDIVLTNEGWSFVSLLVRFLTLSRYSHAAIFVGGFLFDSTGDGVFCDDVRRLVKYNAKQISIYRLKNGLREREKDALERFVRSSIGKSYSVPATLIVGIRKWFRPRETGTAKEYCSRFIAQAYKSIGRELVNNCNYCTPRALARSKKLCRVNDCYRIINFEDEVVLSLENRTLENRKHLKSWLDEVKNIPLAQKENVATENDAYDFVSRHPEYDGQIAQLITESNFLEDYKVFFARYSFKLSVSGLYSMVGGTGYLRFLHHEVADIQKAFRFAENLRICECNYMVLHLEVMRLLRDLYFKLTYILLMRLVVLETVTRAQGVVETENSNLLIVVRLRDSLSKLLQGVSVDNSIFSAEERLCLSEAEGLARKLI